MNGNELLIQAIRGHIESRIKQCNEFPNEQRPLNPYSIIEQGMLAILDDYERLLKEPKQSITKYMNNIPVGDLVVLPEGVQFTNVSTCKKCGHETHTPIK